MARTFYEDIFQPDNLPHDPKELLLDILHRYTFQAEGLHQDHEGCTSGRTTP